MIPEPLSLDTDAMGSAYSFVKIQTLSNRSEWVNDPSVGDAVLTDNYASARIQHMTSGKLKSDPTYLVDRHNITIFISVPNATAEGRIDIGSVGLTVAVPNSGVVTRAMLNEALYAIKSYIENATQIDRFIRKES